MITEINTIEQYNALAEAIREANERAQQVAKENSEDWGTCNFDSPVLKVKFSKAIWQQSMLQLNKCTWGYYMHWYFVNDVRLQGQGNLRTRMAEAAAKHLQQAGYMADVYYEMD